MIDDVPGDLVTKDNEAEWRQKFCDDVGHTHECVEDTVNKMANIIRAVADIHNAPVDAIIEMIGVEEFDRRLRQLLSLKECNCGNDK